MPNHTSAHQDFIINKAAGYSDSINEAVGRFQSELDHIDAAGTISELLVAINELDKKISDRDETIAALEQQIRDLEANK
jgi:peptidoglycan hydrolase CwlO-like protein